MVRVLRFSAVLLHQQQGYTLDNKPTVELLMGRYISSLRHYLRPVRAVFYYSRAAYRSRCSVLGAQGLAEKVRILGYVVRALFLRRRRALFYPDKPKSFFVIYKILQFLGYHITADPSKRFDIAVNWQNSLDGNPFLPIEPALSELAHTRPTAEFLNMQCNDVSKKRVSTVFEKTFGYALTVDPQTYSGKCVMKLNGNGLHVGHIIDCPSALQENDFVYQKLIHNELDNGLVEDVRVPIFRNQIPFVYLKYRPVDERLVDRKHTNTRAVIAEVSDVLSAEELEKIMEFCRTIGLDYGEIDILRDRDERRIYIVDVNNNPAGPPEPISEEDSRTAIGRLAQAFQEAFTV
jgi:hypothetical protein